MRDDIDISDCNSAEEAAEEVTEFLKDYAENSGYNRSEVILKDPEDYKRNAWAVMWESGPFEWAISVTGGESISGAEFPEFGRGTSEIEGFYNNEDWSVEVGNSFTLEFIPDENGLEEL